MKPLTFGHLISGLTSDLQIGGGVKSFTSNGAVRYASVMPYNHRDLWVSSPQSSREGGCIHTYAISEQVKNEIKTSNESRGFEQKYPVRVYRDLQLRGVSSDFVIPGLFVK